MSALGWEPSPRLAGDYRDDDPAVMDALYLETDRSPELESASEPILIPPAPRTPRLTRLLTQTYSLAVVAGPNDAPASLANPTTTAGAALTNATASIVAAPWDAGRTAIQLSAVAAGAEQIITAGAGKLYKAGTTLYWRVKVASSLSAAVIAVAVYNKSPVFRVSPSTSYTMISSGVGQPWAEITGSILLPTDITSAALFISQTATAAADTMTIGDIEFSTSPVGAFTDPTPGVPSVPVKLASPDPRRLSMRVRVLPSDPTVTTDRALVATDPGAISGGSSSLAYLLVGRDSVDLDSHTGEVWILPQNTLTPLLVSVAIVSGGPGDE